MTPEEAEVALMAAVGLYEGSNRRAWLRAVRAAYRQGVIAELEAALEDAAPVGREWYIEPMLLRARITKLRVKP